MNERAGRRQRDDAEQPEDEKDQNNGPEHLHAPPFADGLARKVRAMGDVALARPRPVPLSDAVPARLTRALSPSKRERPSAEAEGRSSGGRTLVTALRADLG